MNNNYTRARLGFADDLRQSRCPSHQASVIIPNSIRRVMISAVRVGPGVLLVVRGRAAPWLQKKLLNLEHLLQGSASGQDPRI